MTPTNPVSPPSPPSGTTPERCLYISEADNQCTREKGHDGYCMSAIGGVFGGSRVAPSPASETPTRLHATTCIHCGREMVAAEQDHDSLECLWCDRVSAPALLDEGPMAAALATEERVKEYGAVLDLVRACGETSRTYLAMKYVWDMATENVIDGLELNRLRSESASLLARATAAEQDSKRLDWIEAHHYEAVSLAVGKAWPKQPLRDAVDAGIDAARSPSEVSPT